MQYKEFQGLSISTLGMGGIRFPTLPGHPNLIDRAKGQAVIDTAMAAGINYYDTAWSYLKGDSEAFLGEALKKYPRETFFLATKFYVAYTTDIAATLQTQLHRLQVDYLDFYMLHCLDESTIGPYMDQNRGYVDFMRDQKSKGTVRHIGFSSHAAPETLARFLDWYDGFDMALIQLNYLDWDLLRAKQQYEILTSHHIPVWVMEPLKGGRLASLNDQAIQTLKAAAPDKSIPSWSFRFLQSLPNVQTVLSGMTTPEQVLENAAVFSNYEPFCTEEWNALTQAKAEFMESLGVPCSACRYCCDTCPADLNIPLLIQSYNEIKLGGSLWKIPGLSETIPATACLQCGICQKRCPQNIDIPSIMRELQNM